MTSAAERWALLLAAIVLGVGLHGIEAADIVGDDEAREVGIVQDVAAGHVLWPRFDDALLPDKPILSHWLAAIPVTAGGFSERTVRLPSVLATAALVGWTVVLGDALWGLPSGIAAGVMLATMPALLDHARVCRPDALLVLFLSAALGMAFSWWRSGQPRDAVVAWALVGLATFTKGPVGVGLFVIAFGSFLVWQRDLARLRSFLPWRGLLLFAVVGLGWYAVALAGWGEVFVREHLVGRYVRNLTGGLVEGHAYSHRPLLYHLLFYPTHLPAAVLPWTPWILLALWRFSRRGGLTDPRVRFLLCWALAPVIAFTPAEWKLRYYLLPSLPALALLAGPAAVALFEERAARRRPPDLWRALLGFVVGIALSGVVTTAVAWVLTNPDRLSESDRGTLSHLASAVGGPDQLLRMLGTVVGLTSAVVVLRSWPTLVACVATMSLFWSWSVTPLMDAAMSREASFKSFARAVAVRVPAHQPIAFWGKVVRPVVVYLGRPAPSLARTRARLTPGMALLVPLPAWERLQRDGLVGDVLLRGDGRVGNLEHGTLVLAEVSAPPP